MSVQKGGHKTFNEFKIYYVYIVGPCSQDMFYNINISIGIGVLIFHVLLQIMVNVYHGRQRKQSYDAVQSRKYREKMKTLYGDEWLKKERQRLRKYSKSAKRKSEQN